MGVRRCLGDEEAMELQERPTVDGGMFSLLLVSEMRCFRFGMLGERCVVGDWLGGSVNFG